MKRKNEDAPYWVMMRAAERNIIEWALEQTGSARQAAIFLGINVSHIYKRCRVLDIDFRNIGVCDPPSQESAPQDEPAESL